MKKLLLALAAITLLFLVTRLVKINEIPASLYWDEASIGYNAYSVLKTGRDEWGEFLPLHFRAFGEFKLPVYVYSVLVAEIFLGLSELSVRLPAVFFSLGTVLLTYLIVAKISKKRWLGVLSAFVLSVSPWLFLFSRIGYEATAGLMFFLAGFYFLLLMGRNKLFLLASAFSFILSFYSYNSFRVLIPLSLIILFLVFFREIKGKYRGYWKVGAISVFIFALSLVPVAKLYLKDVGTVRFQTVSVGSAGGFVKNYLSHFSPNFLFLKGDANLRSQIGTGELYFVDIVFLVAGALAILKSKNKYLLFLLALLLISPIPASLTRESPHALRAIAMAPLLAVISSLGVFYLGDLVPKYKKHFFAATTIAYLIFFVNYLTVFFGNYKERSSQDWQYGYKRLFQGSRGQITKADKAIVSDEYGQPYIFSLFYLGYDPAVFQREVQRNTPDKWGFSSASGFGKFVFKKIESGDLKKGNLVFATPSDKQKEEATSEIKFLDGSEAFFVYQK